MALNIGINGFGGLGRLVFLRLLNDKSVNVTAINDGAKPELLAYRLKYDTVPGGPFADSLEAGPGFIGVKGREIRVLEEKDPAKLPWKKLKTDLVLECGGLNRRQAAAHLEAGAKRVLLAGTAGGDPPLIVFGVNEKTLGSRDRIIAAAGPILNSLALIAGALHEGAPIRSAFFTAIQAEAGEPAEEAWRLPGGPGAGQTEFRRFRSAGLVPAGAGTSLIGLVIPGLAGRVAGAVLRVPNGGSSLILSAVVQTASLDAETINQMMKAKSNRVLGYNDEGIVSSDAAGMEYGALFDATQTQVLPLEGEKNLYQVRAAAWYDKKSSAASQLLRIIRRLAGNTAGGAARKAGAGQNPPKRGVVNRIGDTLPHRKPLINYQR
jgi:glyceraldehyde 3-phosphate dehydrogenase